MIWIQAATRRGGITISIDGQFIGEYVAEVETSIRQSMEQYKDVHLFLRNVSHIDEKGHALLSQLAALGVELSADGLYSSHVVSQIQALASLQSPVNRTGDARRAFGTVFRRLTVGTCRGSPRKSH